MYNPTTTGGPCDTRIQLLVLRRHVGPQGGRGSPTRVTHEIRSQVRSFQSSPQAVRFGPIQRVTVVNRRRLPAGGDSLLQVRMNGR
jgi:hypothetical protein